MAYLLLVVEKASPTVAGQGTQLDPWFPLTLNEESDHDTDKPPLSFPCLADLKRPDGSTLRTPINSGSAHVIPVDYHDPHWYDFYWLPLVSASEVPPGTEVWIGDDM